MRRKSIPATTMLLTTMLILSSGLAQETLYGNFPFPPECNGSTLTLDSSVGITLRKNFIVLPELKCLAIPYSGVKAMQDGAFDGVPNLIYLNLDGNLIPPDKLFSFGKFPSLQTLMMRDQQYNSTVNKVLVPTVYPSLKTLILSGTKRTSLSANVNFALPVLQHLDHSWNYYTVYQPSDNLYHDTIDLLDLSHNQITAVALRKQKSLKTLMLHDNKIQSIGYGNDLDLVGLKSLGYLTLANNRISSINKTAFNDTTNLWYLDLSNNSLTDSDANVFSSLASLQMLDLSHNRFRMVPFHLPANLTNLSMNCNNVSYLVLESLYKLPELKVLSMGGNRISSIDRTTFLYQGLLEELYLNDNRLSNLPTHWDVHLRSLRYLNLAGNRFTSIQAALKLVLSPVREVRLDGNPIVAIDHNALKGIPENTTIYLNIGVERTEDVCRRSNVTLMYEV